MELYLAVAGRTGGRPTLVERVPRLSSYGAQCFEITWDGFHSWDLASCRREAEALAAAGLALYSVHAPFGPGLSIIDLNQGARRHAVEAHLTVIRGAAEFGVKILVVHPGRELRETCSVSEASAACVEVLKPIVEAAAARGMRVALENCLPAHVLHSPEAIRQIVEQVNHPALGICLDTGHAHLESSVGEAFEIFSQRIIHFHLHDNLGQADDHLCPTLGTIDWEDFMSRLGALELNLPLTLECHLPEGMSADQVVPFVRQKLGLDSHHEAT